MAMLINMIVSNRQLSFFKVTVVNKSVGGIWLFPRFGVMAAYKPICESTIKSQSTTNLKVNK